MIGLSSKAAELESEGIRTHINIVYKGEYK